MMTNEPSQIDRPATPKPTVSGSSSKNRPFGANLEPALLNACDGKLSDIHWFRTDWQRGGALTGYGKYQADDGEQNVVIKYPVPPQERRWLMRTQTDQHDLGDITPKLYAHGVELGHIDMAWLVMEKLPYGFKVNYQILLINRICCKWSLFIFFNQYPDS